MKHGLFAFLALCGLASFSHAQSGIQVMLDFTGDGGSTPGGDSKGSMTLVGDTLYGFTSSGGTNVNTFGTIFSVNTNGTGYTVLQSFSSGNNALGSQPHHGFLTVEGGTIIRPLLFGGANGQGTIFKVSTNGTGATAAYTFTGNAASPTALGDGAQPHSGLLKGSGTTYYGMTAKGGSNDFGTIFSYDSSSDVVTTLYAFDTAKDAHGQLIWDSTGTTLLGMTREGGTGNGNANSGNNPPGTIFSFNPNTQVYSTLYNFTTNGGSPYFTDHGILTLGTGAYSTTIFGMTQFGGDFDQGAIFSLSETGGIPTVIHSFGSSGSDGLNPFGSLTMAPDGWLYGMTRNGGDHGDGTIFRIGQDGTGYLKIDSFHDSVTGGKPIDNITISADGRMIYGLTEHGGANGKGTIFSLDLAATLPIPEPNPLQLFSVAAFFFAAASLIRKKLSGKRQATIA